METKETEKTRVLTKEVAQAVVRCTKYRLKNEKENVNLQEKLFEIGCEWINGGKEVKNEDCKFLFVSVNLNITISDSEEIFVKQKFSELEVNDVLNITINEMEAEVKEIEKTDMETKEMKKEMTQEEIFDFLKETKILCTSAEESANVQKKLLELGVEWINKRKEVLENKYLLFISGKHILQSCSDIEYWIEDVYRRIEPSEILAIQLKEEKPKFDPRTLQPFDKVLVRDECYEKWRADFLDIIDIDNGNYSFRSIKAVYKQLIPYNEETKHLIGTANEAPEFYRI